MTTVEAPQPLSAADSLMWRIEADPVLRSSVLVVGLLDRPPRPRDLRAAIERVAGDVPGLTHRLAPPPLGLGRPTWQAVEPLSLDHHLRVMHLRGGCGLRDVLDLATPEVTAPFDPERPPWSLTVVDGLDHGAAFLLRFHHSIADGVGALRLARTLLDTSRRPPRPPSGKAARPATAPRPAPPSPVAGLARAAAAVTRTAVGTARRPLASAGRSARLGRSLWRSLQPAPPGGSPLFTGRSLDRTLHAVEVPLADLLAVADATGGTVNDVLLAAVGGAYRAYHQRHGVDVATMHTSMPVNRRADGEPGGGNRFTMTRFVLPVDDPDPAVRARIAGAIVRRWRREPALGATDALVAGFDLLPAPAVARVFGGLLRANDVNVVDLRGLEGPTYLAGAQVERLWAFAPTAGTACSVTLLSHGETGCVALACDPAAVDDPGMLASCLVAELEGLGARV